jgi:hypothetical protein
MNQSITLMYLTAIQSRSIDAAGMQRPAYYNFINFQTRNPDQPVAVSIQAESVALPFLSPHAHFWSCKQMLDQGLNIWVTNSPPTVPSPEEYLERFAINSGFPISIFEKMERAAQKPIQEFQEQDFKNYTPSTLSQVGPLDMPLEHRFMAYHGSFHHNQYLQFLNSIGNTHAAITDAEFLRRNGDAPWVTLNRILKMTGSGYQVSPPDPVRINASYICRFKHDDGGPEISINEFSSGERILFALALLRHGIVNWEVSGLLPDVLLLDEIDAVLHPSLTATLIRVIQDELVSTQKMHVIMTTHSPSTVALAPEESIWVMNRTGPQRLEKAKKDVALGLLTRDVPALSIEPENRRNVLVESGFDATAFEHFYRALKKDLIPGISLNFVGSGQNGVGNCDAVEHIVKAFAETGNKKVFGIVDWDYSKVSNVQTQVMALGDGQRHSIENYAFDPIFLAFFMVHEQKLEPLPGLKDFKGLDFLTFDQAKIQDIVNIVCQRVQPFAETEHQRMLEEKKPAADQISFGPETDSCLYMNGFKISIPRWYLKFRGHDLFLALRNAFPAIKRFQQAHEILAIVAHNLPSFISKDIYDLFLTIQGPQNAAPVEIAQPVRITQEVNLDSA